MIEGEHVVLQSLLGTLFTWFVTALGSAVVFLFPDMRRKPLDASLGFAAGVMLAASYWSLLEPSIETAISQGYHGFMSVFPTCAGILLGSLFVILADYLLPSVDYNYFIKRDEEKESMASNFSGNSNARLDWEDSGARLRRRRSEIEEEEGLVKDESVHQVSWKRILLLIIAITVHNIPEGLAVGVSFGCINKSSTCTFASSRNLAVGIAIQNFPEGLAVSVPLRASGVSPLKAFWYGQLSGMVEPLAGLTGALGVTLAEPLLPYVLAFAAGAMIFVVVDDIIPEAQTHGNGRIASITCILGFIVMMVLDVVLE